MQTLAIVVLALLSLIAGSIIEPPAAKAAGRSRAAANHAAAVDAKPDDKAPYRVVSEDSSTESSRRHVAVVLSKRIAEAEIGRIADIVRAQERAPFERTLVNFYLPGMKIGQGAWATAAYNPALKVSIVGLRLDEEQTAVSEAASDSRALVGVWLTAPPAAPGRLTIFRDGPKVLAEWRLRNGNKSVEELIEACDPKGRRLTPKTGGTDHYLLTWSGELELRDGQTVTAIAEKLPGAWEKAAAKAAHAGTKHRARIATTASAPTSSAAADQALSDKLFKN